MQRGAMKNPNVEGDNLGSSSSEGFALMLETGCRDFETLSKLVRSEVLLVDTAGEPDLGAHGSIVMALAKSFVFYAVRAARICEHGSQHLKISREARKAFLNGVRPVINVRDVNEHGFDASRSGRKSSRPSMHTHEAEGAALDETSLIVLDDKKILMGPINLYEIYLRMSEMRHLAGFSTSDSGRT